MTWTKYRNNFLNYADECGVDIDIDSDEWLEDICPELKRLWEKGNIDVESAFEMLF